MLVLFIVTLAAIACLLVTIQKQAMQPKVKLQPIKIEQEETRRRVHRRIR